MSNLPQREVKELFYGEDARSKVMAGAEKMYEAVSAVYGPRASNALLGLPFGDPTLTRDGVTVAKRISGPNVGLKNRAEADAAAVLRQASEKTNKTAGDGTTATIVLAYHLLKAAHQRVVAGENPMVIKRQIEQDAKVVTDFLASQSQPAEGHLLEVATVSSGDPSIGELVADTMAEIGSEGGITIREQGYPVVEAEKVNGYYFSRGFFALNQQIEYQSPLIFVTQKRLVTNSDILPLLTVVANSDNRKLVIVGDVSGDALNTLIMNAMQGKLEAAVIPPPQYGDEGKLFLEDVATYVGSKLFMQADNPVTTFRPRTMANGQLVLEDVQRIVKESGYFGSAERVQVNQDRAIIFTGAGDSDEITSRAAAIKEQAHAESNAHKKEQLEGRYSKLVGKIAIINVGGSTPTEMEELRFRVEDAIEATKSAMQDGVLPGGGTVLVRASFYLKDLSTLTRDALQSTIAKLLDNAAEPAQYRLKQIVQAEEGYGFNLRDMTEDPIDLAKAGIWDATRAVVQTVENAASAAGALLTVGTIITPVDQDAEKSAA